MAEEEEEPAQPEIVIPSEQLAGVWANWARVRYSRHEFTIDFMRTDPIEPRAIVVARVSGSSLFVMELIDRLRAVWQHWAKGAMPPEMEDGDDRQNPDEPLA
jgi:hypothetical protein